MSIALATKGIEATMASVSLATKGILEVFASTPAPVPLTALQRLIFSPDGITPSSQKQEEDFSDVMSGQFPPSVGT